MFLILILTFYYLIAFFNLENAENVENNTTKKYLVHISSGTGFKKEFYLQFSNCVLSIKEDTFCLSYFLRHTKISYTFSVLNVFKASDLDASDKNKF